MDWQSKTTVKKGNVGEKIVNDYLIKNGYIPYSPNAEGAHPFDRLCASKDKKTLFITEVKTKPARVYYPDTGIDIRHYNGYKYVHDKYNIDVLLIFVDQDMGKVYGNHMRILDIPRVIDYNGKRLAYPLVQNNIIYFPLYAMVDIGFINNKELELLNIYTTRNDGYTAIAKNKKP